jgi:hypothetical protein
MNKLQYQEYLQSSHWRTMRRKALENAEHSCQLCNSDSALNVHHRTYERLGRERLTDLIVLCRDCHAKFHDKLETVNTGYVRPPTPQRRDDDDSGEWVAVDDTEQDKERLKYAAGDGLGRWVELAWYRMCRVLGMSVPDAIEDVSRELNSGGHKRHIQDGL